MDPISLAIGGGLMLLGLALGRISRSRRAAPPPRPIRSCNHGLAFHDQKNGTCHATYNGFNDKSGEALMACTCRQYDGPKPVEQFFATQMLPPSDGA